MEFFRNGSKLLNLYKKSYGTTSYEVLQTTNYPKTNFLPSSYIEPLWNATIFVRHIFMAKLTFFHDDNLILMDRHYFCAT